MNDCPRQNPAYRPACPLSRRRRFGFALCLLPLGSLRFALCLLPSSGRRMTACSLTCTGQESSHVACSGILPPILPEEGSKQRAWKCRSLRGTRKEANPKRHAFPQRGMGTDARAGTGARSTWNLSGFGESDAGLPLVFPAAVLVRGLAHFAGLKEDHLRHALVGVDFRRQRRGVGEFQRDVALPLRL